MYLCIPVDETPKLEARLCLHFSAAAKFMVVDPDTESYEIFEHPDPEQKDSARLIRFFSLHKVTHVAVGGISLELLDDLQRAGIQVFSSAEDTAAGIVRAFNAGTVNPVNMNTVPCRRKEPGRGFAIPTCGGGFRRHGGNCSGGC